MRFLSERLLFAVVMAVAVATAAKAVDVPQAEWEQMKKDIQELRNSKNQTAAPIESTVDCALDNKYGPNAPVYTKTGKLRIGALTQVWYYQFLQHDQRGLFDDPSNSGVRDQFTSLNNSSFRIRRTELHFSMDMTENVTSYVIADPAREGTDYPNMPWQATSGNFKRTNNVAPEWIAVNKSPGLNSTAQIAAVQAGTGTTNRILQDAWIDYHGVVPHHDFLIGQYHPWFGEEGMRTSRELDFVERSQVGFIGDSRDLGASIHGAWWDVDDKTPAYSANPSGRFQYWLEVVDGAGTFHSAGAYQNRPDDNQQKDFGYRVLVRPLWGKNDCGRDWGNLELGMSSQFGEHGHGGSLDPIVSPELDLNRNKVWAYRHDAWLYYAPGSVAKGLWIRGEYMQNHDRLAPGAAIDLAGGGDNPKALFAQDNPSPFTSQGFYAAFGYKMSESRWNSDCGGMPSWLKPFEWTARYDTYQNIQVADPAHNNLTRLNYTTVWTGGFNYYLKGHNAKIQVNYNKVVLPKSNVPSYNFHQTNMDNLMTNFQVAF